MNNKTRAIYAGTFDPITNGHLDVIVRASKMFDEIIIAVADSQAKNTMFSLKKRTKMVKNCIKKYSNIKVVGFNNLLVNLSNELNANILIRGIRTVSDFEYELQMGYANASLKKELETVYLMPTLENAFVSSSIVRTILNFEGEVSHLVPKEILNEIKGKK